MYEKIEKIDIGLSLADAELDSYFYKKNNLCVRIKTFNMNTVEFVFKDLLLFVDRGGNFVMDFCLNSTENELFKEAIKKVYEIIPRYIPYKLYQFLDIGNEPYLEIICKNYEIKLINAVT